MRGAAGPPGPAALRPARTLAVLENGSHRFLSAAALKGIVQALSLLAPAVFLSYDEHD